VIRSIGVSPSILERPGGDYDTRDIRPAGIDAHVSVLSKDLQLLPLWTQLSSYLAIYRGNICSVISEKIREVI
jgi:hypothetical protein